MTDPTAAARAVILAKLARSREELRTVFEPPGPESNGDSGVRAGGFPRSRTVQMLMSGRGLGTLGALAAGLAVARPALALRILRMLPATALGRMLLLRVFTALRAKP